ncbi:DUF1284 domain-containing protein [Beduini massiliensis]|uniref:DUF1284 domain-containing protein n=1 Tax=Beduini massiliensis TaxID=1585974 RepID=UPI00356A9671
MIIKPHHFLDIIKLYGAGIEHFVPDTQMNHDFYKAANEIISNPQTTLILTKEADDICQPCIKLKQGVCADPLTKYCGFSLKDDYNKALDQRMLEQFDLDETTQYSATELCQIIYKNIEKIFMVWREEEKEAVQKRYDLFCIGAKKYLGL